MHGKCAIRESPNHPTFSRCQYGILQGSGSPGLGRVELYRKLRHGPAREMSACAPGKMDRASHPITLDKAGELMHLRRLGPMNQYPSKSWKPWK